MSCSSATIPVYQFLSETTAHGLSRLGGNRPLYVRLFWALSFLSLTVVFSVSFVTSVQKYLSYDSKTTFYTEKEPFEFPDLYVCGINPFSGSFSLSLTEKEVDELRNQVDSIYLALPEEMQGVGGTSDFIKAIVNTMEFQTLVDRLGHRTNQMVILAQFLGEGTKTLTGHERYVTNVSTFYHPEFLTCAQLMWTAFDRSLLKQSDHGIHIDMIADRLTSEFPTENQLNISVGTLKVHPPDWNFAHGWNIFGESGLRLFLVEPGTLPTPWSTNVPLKSGTNTEIKVYMQQTEVSHSDFPGKCVPDSQAIEVTYHNPYQFEKPYKFNYSYAYCYYRELTQRMQRLLNCTPTRHPIPASEGHLQSCHNATGITANEYKARNDKIDSTREQQNKILSDVIAACSNQHPCRRKSYGVQVSSIDWPAEGSFKNFMTASCFTLLPYVTKQPTPMLNFVCSKVSALLISGNASSSDWQNLLRLVQTQLLQVRVYAEGQLSSKVEVTLDYTLMNMFAETGGFFGLYLGCSVLTLAELLELLHNFAALMLCKTANKVAGSDAEDKGDAAKEAETVWTSRSAIEVEAVQ